MSPALLVGSAAAVALVHSILPDHWVPLAVVGRSQRWSLFKVARISLLASMGHVAVSLLLAALVAAVGLRFQHELETEQGHVIGAILVVTGLGFLGWSFTPGGRAHSHDQDAAPGPSGATHDETPHEHEHEVPANAAGDHLHAHQHGGEWHTHRHRHEEFIAHQEEALASATRRRSFAGELAAVTVPFGIAASPDLTILPVALAAGAFGGAVVAAVLAVFAGVTLLAFVGLTTVAAGVGYQFEGLWLERNAERVTAAVLIAVGLVAFVGL